MVRYPNWGNYMMKKKICLVTNWYPTENNPFQGVFFREQVIALSEYFDFVVLHYEYLWSKTKERVELHFEKREYNITEYTLVICRSRLHKRFHREKLPDRSYDELLFDRACHLLLPENIDIFYSICAQSDASEVAKYARSFNKPYVVSEHGPFPWVGTLITEECKIAIENADLFFAISNDKIRQILMQDVKLPQIWYVGNMVDDSKFKYRKSNNKVKTFITVGANVFYKNYEMLIDTFDKLVQITVVPFKLIVLGYQANKGYSQDSTELENALNASKFANCIEMIPYVPHDNMPDTLSRADAFVMTSIQEGQPVSALEAGCCGLPIFATRCGGIEDYVDDSIGRTVGILESDILASYLKGYLEEEITFEPEVIREKIVSKFGRQQFVNNMVAAFNSVL